MTKFYFFSLLLFISFTSNAQIKKQSFLVGGQLHYYNYKVLFDDRNQKTEAGTINLSIGKAFKENKVAGINIGFSPARYLNHLAGSDTSKFVSNRFNLGMFYREYKKLTKDLYFFGQLDGAFITGKQTEYYNNSTRQAKATLRGGFISLTPGISYQVFKKMQLEITIPNILNIQYLASKTQSEAFPEKNLKEEEFQFNSNITNNTGLGILGVGFRFVL